MNEDLQKMKSAYVMRQILPKALSKEQLGTLAYITAREQIYQEKSLKETDKEKSLGEQMLEIEKNREG